MRLLLLKAVLMALSGAANAAHAGEQPQQQEQRKLDGSWLRLTQLDNLATERRTIRVELPVQINRLTPLCWNAISFWPHSPRGGAA